MQIIIFCRVLNANLFNSLYKSFEVSDSKYKGVDFGHLIIGLDARRNSNSIKTKIPSQGGTGLEICTWVGDLGGGVGKLSLDRIKNPKKRAKTLFSPFGHSYGCMINLEGDIAAYLVGMKSSNPSLIDNCANNFKTIYEAIEDYFNNIWDKRGFYFLKMLGGIFNNNELINKSIIEEYFTKSFENFAAWYIGLRMKEKKLGGIKDFSLAYGYFKPTSEEVASIFMDGLLHIVENPKDMMTARTDPDPKNKENTTIEKMYKKAKKIQNKIEEIGKDMIKKWKI